MVVSARCDPSPTKPPVSIPNPRDLHGHSTRRALHSCSERLWKRLVRPGRVLPQRVQEKPQRLHEVAIPRLQLERPCGNEHLVVRGRFGKQVLVRDLPQEGRLRLTEVFALRRRMACCQKTLREVHVVAQHLNDQILEDVAVRGHHIVGPVIVLHSVHEAALPPIPQPFQNVLTLRRLKARVQQIQFQALPAIPELHSAGVVNERSR
mmetsp:Transcript_8083/g.22329  ORF Transcript_8083/g.22329 Transcript_8083/m.22329 type:complete len:207 (+) Transcript_8083:363-983(+)